jgi:hypothetical protein
MCRKNRTQKEGEINILRKNEENSSKSVPTNPYKEYQHQ